MLVRVKECFSVRVRGCVFTYIPSLRVIDIPENHINETTRRYVEVINPVGNRKIVKKGKVFGERFNRAKSASESESVDAGFGGND